MSPAQFEKRIKIKIVAKNQNVRFTRWWPMIPSKKLCRLSTIHSQKFCAPSGISFMFRVATWAKMISPRATAQVTTIELLIGRPKICPISSGRCGTPCSAGCPGVASVAKPLSAARANCSHPVPPPAIMMLTKMILINRIALKDARKDVHVPRFKPDQESGARKQCPKCQPRTRLFLTSFASLRDRRPWP
ncbi:hypothetical protein SBV1_1600011 [Verrucomicrobia bacterium]|nr:hypothetical protein SBV1_1600011 [Verrucomicrobiota bacterium]